MNDPSVNVQSLSEQLEACIWNEHKDVKNNKYRSRIRSRLINLKENASLRLAYLRNAISPEQVQYMTLFVYIYVLVGNNDSR